LGTYKKVLGYVLVAHLAMAYPEVKSPLNLRKKLVVRFHQNSVQALLYIYGTVLIKS